MVRSNNCGEIDSFVNISLVTIPKAITFLDIETTGGSIIRDRIVEIGAIRIENGIKVKEFSTLINPQQRFPEEISALTGISPHELENAPTFRAVKDELTEILEGSVLAAHNARFDYGFLKAEFKREEKTFSHKHFCTVKLSRALYPQHLHHNLDAVIERFGIICSNRHRALGDAQVLWDFFQIAQKDVGEKEFGRILGLLLRRPSLPAGIKPEIIEELPEAPGVYIFYGHEGAPLYIGKSVNIRERVLSHFANDTDSPTEMRISQTIESIETIQTAGELGALVRESRLIKELQPLYNRKLRKADNLIFAIEGNSNGYKTAKLTVGSWPDGQVLGVFKSKSAARDYLWETGDKHRLCKKLLGLEKGSGSCFDVQIDKCNGACNNEEPAEKYNLRFDLAFVESKIKAWPFGGPIIISEDSENHVIDNWCYLGSVRGEKSETVRPEFDLDIYKIINGYLRKKNNQIKIKTILNKINQSELAQQGFSLKRYNPG